MAALALEIVRAAGEHCWPDGTPVRVRVGLHCGPATTGVLGDVLPHWAVFGRTVVLASRMESSGAPGRVHATANFVAALRGGEGGGGGEGAGAAGAGAVSLAVKAPEGAFSLVLREPTADIKGVGPLESWWIEEAAASTPSAGSTGSDK